MEGGGDRQQEKKRNAGWLLTPQVSVGKHLKHHEKPTQVEYQKDGADNSKSYMKQLSCEYYWPKMERDVKDYTRSCDSCQRVKAERDLKFGLLHPLEVPESRCTNLGFDFIVDLPVVAGMSIIAVVVDHLT
jgi:hypothetical protein